LAETWTVEQLSLLLGFGSVHLGAQVGCGCASTREVASEDGLDNGVEDNLGATGDWECQPENKDELEGVVEWEPVDGADGALEDSQEGKDYPVREPLCIVRFANSEKGLQGIVAGNHETSNISEQLASDVEEDKEEVGCDQSEEGIDLRNRGLLLQVVQSRVLGELLIDQRNVALSFVLKGHVGDGTRAE